MYNIYISYSEEQNYKYFSIITFKNNIIRGSHFNDLVGKTKYYNKKYEKCTLHYDLDKKPIYKNGYQTRN
jgi:hypothetical protein